MKLPVAPVAAGVLGGIVMFCLAALPGDLLEAWVTGSGLPSVIAAAEPPLGFTARTGLALGLGGLVAGFTWLSLFVLLGNRSVSLRRPAKPVRDLDMPPPPTIRRADAHPDAPPRPPLLATRDLGMPFPEPGVKISIKAAPEPVAAEPMPLAPIIATIPDVQPTRTVEPVTFTIPNATPGEQPLPRDLDQPLAAFDPQAIPDVPVAAPETPPPPPLLRPKPVARERFEVFELTPPVRAVPTLPPRAAPVPARAEPIARPETEASVHALLERLERGVVQHALTRISPAQAQQDHAERGLQDALLTLRNLARQA